MSTTSSAYVEIIDFIASGTTPAAVDDFRPSAEARKRVAELIEREKEIGLSPEEGAELDHFMELEHILRMAGVRRRPPRRGRPPDTTRYRPPQSTSDWYSSGDDSRLRRWRAAAVCREW